MSKDLRLVFKLSEWTEEVPYQHKKDPKKWEKILKRAVERIQEYQYILDDFRKQRDFERWDSGYFYFINVYKIIAAFKENVNNEFIYKDEVLEILESRKFEHYIQLRDAILEQIRNKETTLSKNLFSYFTIEVGDEVD